MSIDELPAVTSIEDVLRDSVIAHLQEVVLRPTVHYLSLDLIKTSLESGDIDPASALAHLELMDV